MLNLPLILKTAVMQKRTFILIDRCMGWLAFTIAAITYCLTIEPTASLWDCPEFITCGYKLEIGHAPGAPFFMLMANLFSQFASSPSEVARMVNLLSALLSAGCILFLFWTITHLVRRLVISNNDYTRGNVVLIEACGLVGTLAYTWSDTFWFSAVEAEVYAFSSFLTALVFWLILKWDDEADSSTSDRWIILIAYIIGLSIGVHLLNLLCIPPMVLFMYYRKAKKITCWRTIGTVVVGALVVALVLYGFIPGIVRIGGWFELLMTNTFGLAYNTGLCVYVLLLAVGIIVWVVKARARLWHTMALSVMSLLLGYSCYAVILVRSSANPPMDENSPDNIFSLGYYLGREQYEDKPLIYGPAYTSEVEREPQGAYLVPRFKDKGAIYQKSPDTTECRYVEVGRKREYLYQQNMLFPRMHSERHSEAYGQWLGGVKVVNGLPTQWDNLRFFFSYQVNHMYLRYLFWNFVGRENNIQGHGEAEHGNWITGISWIDDMLLGCDCSMMPSDLKNNKGRNTFYGLPLLLGVLGMIWQIRRGKHGSRQWKVIMLLFLMTGLAIVVYLNQTPVEPRERDYAYAGSFYAYAIWIGMGVAGLSAMLRKMQLKRQGSLIAIVLGMLVPLQMVSQTWDDHDRSGRYVCRDFGANYLNSMQDEGCPVIFTNGDNDTFPLWYNHEVEGVRTDTRVCNLSYAQTDWYIDQMKRPAYNSPSLPITWSREQYTEGRNEFVAVAPDDSMTIEYMGQPMTIHMNGATHLSKSDLLVLEMLEHTPGNRPLYLSISLGGSLLPFLQDHLVLEGLAYRIVPECVGKKIDVEHLYDNVMNRFRYGGLSQPGLYIDEDAMRMAHTHQFVMSMLITKLMEHGDMKRAKEVADKWLTELPNYNVPYTEDALAMAECYYRLEDYGKADEIVENLLRRSSEWISWYNSLELRGKSISQFHKNSWFRTMQHALITANNNKRAKLIDNYIKTYEDNIK